MKITSIDRELNTGQNYISFIIIAFKIYNEKLPKKGESFANKLSRNYYQKYFYEL